MQEQDGTWYNNALMQLSPLHVAAQLQLSNFWADIKVVYRPLKFPKCLLSSLNQLVVELSSLPTYVVAEEIAEQGIFLHLELDRSCLWMIFK